jgi:hypothetical protein
MLMPATEDEQASVEPLPAMPQSSETDDPAESQWPLPTPAEEVPSWQPDRTAPPAAWSDEALPESTGQEQVLSPQLSEMHSNTADF